MTNLHARADESVSELPRENSSSMITKLDEQTSCTMRFTFGAQVHSEFLRSRGFSRFEDFWNLPHQFVDDINYRKGGWSGVSLLSLGEKNAQRNFYVKRQVNQFRYSLRKPFGALTFEHEVLAIERNRALHLPTVDVACWGIRKESGSAMGLLATPEIDFCSLEDILANNQFTPSLGVLLYRCGEQLLEMHSHRIQHGALYPKHIYIDQKSGAIKLIDFERARKRALVRSAIQADLRQLTKHLVNSPFEVGEMLLRPYQLDYSSLLSSL